MDKHIVVTGLMGVGKTTTSTELAQRMGLAQRDSDTDIEALFGLTGAEIADRDGIEELHRLEAAVLLGALGVSEPAIICAAASVVEDPKCVLALANRAHVVVLQASVDEIVHRAESGAHRRPISREGVQILADRRAPLFASAADLTLDATLPTARLVDEICATLRPSS